MATTKTIGTATGSAGTGTVTAAASTTVTGVGTAFLTEMVDGNGFPVTMLVSGTLHQVASIASNTSLTLTAAATFTAAAFTRGSRNFSLVATWLAAFATGGWIGQAYADTEFVTTATLSFSGHATSATDYITLQCGSGQSYKDNANKLTNDYRYTAANGVAMRNTDAYQKHVLIAEDYVTITGIQFRGPSKSGNIEVTTTGTHGVIEYCIVEQYSDGGATPAMGLRAGTMRNCLLRTGHTGSQGLSFGYAATPIAVNCTIVRPSELAAGGTALGQSNGTSTTKNCAFFGFQTFFSGGGTQNGSNNASDLTVSFGTSNQSGKTYASQFESTTTADSDFRAKTGADLLNNGVTDTTNLPAADDAVGTARPQGASWDIGSWELVVASVTWAAFVQPMFRRAVERRRYVQAFFAPPMVVPVAITGSLAVTEANDTIAAAGTVAIVGSLAKTEANDTVVAAGIVPIDGDLAVAEANDTISAAGTVPNLGSLVVTEANDTISATGAGGGGAVLPTGGAADVARRKYLDWLANRPRRLKKKKRRDDPPAPVQVIEPEPVEPKPRRPVKPSAEDIAEVLLTANVASVRRQTSAVAKAVADVAPVVLAALEKGAEDDDDDILALLLED